MRPAPRHRPGYRSHYVPRPGERPVPLDDSYPRAVVFIGIPENDDDPESPIKTVGTGFIVSCSPSRRSRDARPPKPFRYVVTARHVVEGAKQTYVRARPSGEEYEAAPISELVAQDEWFGHADGRVVDVAVARFDPAGDNQLTSIPFHAFTDPDLRDANGYAWLRPLLGDRLFFLGLLSSNPGMVERIVPMVRSGTIGALFESDVEVEGGRRFKQAHLIDCRSFDGFSGSPCFYQRDNVIAPPGRLVGPTDQPTEMTLALGLFSGHYPLAVEARADPRDQGGTKLHIWTPIPSGVGVVTPAHQIREVLMTLKKTDDETRPDESGPIPLPVTLDSAREESEYDRFDNLARKLVDVPKSEVDALRKQEGD